MLRKIIYILYIILCIRGSIIVFINEFAFFRFPKLTFIFMILYALIIFIDLVIKSKSTSVTILYFLFFVLSSTSIWFDFSISNFIMIIIYLLCLSPPLIIFLLKKSK